MYPLAWDDRRLTSNGAVQIRVGLEIADKFLVPGIGGLQEEMPFRLLNLVQEVCRVLAADKCSIFFVNEARKEVVHPAFRLLTMRTAPSHHRTSLTKRKN